jgi:hypothetical protein
VGFAAPAALLLHRRRQEGAGHRQGDRGGEEEAARLDRDTLYVDDGHGPWQRRLAETGGIEPLAFGQFGGVGPGLEALLAGVAKRGADEMAGRYLIESREAAAGMQLFHLRQRWGAAIWRAQTQVLLSVGAGGGWVQARSGNTGGGRFQGARRRAWWPSEEYCCAPSFFPQLKKTADVRLAAASCRPLALR